MGTKSYVFKSPQCIFYMIFKIINKHMGKYITNKIIKKKRLWILSGKDDLTDYKKIFFIGIIIISLGIVLSTTLNEILGSLGIVFIAIGGLLFIVAMKKKKDMNNS